MLKTAGEHIAFLRSLVSRGGPEENEWDAVKEWMYELGEAIAQEKYSGQEIARIYAEIGDAFPASTIQGHTYHKPRKYAGDFELLDRIQTSYVTDDVHFANWDRYFHSCEAPRAVRYRIPYLIGILEEIMNRRNDRFSFLDIASGPCRDIAAFYKMHPDADIQISCVEHDADAVAFSRSLLNEHAAKVKFYNTSFLKFYFEEDYDFIWSAGLFDYFDDTFFVRKLKLMIGHLNPGGKILLGNLSTTNPSKYYMLLFKWGVYHRTQEQLIKLAVDAGAEEKNISVCGEPLGVNLFLHIAK